MPVGRVEAARRTGRRRAGAGPAAPGRPRRTEATARRTGSRRPRSRVPSSRARSRRAAGRRTGGRSPRATSRAARVRERPAGRPRSSAGSSTSGSPPPRAPRAVEPRTLVHEVVVGGEDRRSRPARRAWRPRARAAGPGPVRASRSAGGGPRTAWRHATGLVAGGYDRAMSGFSFSARVGEAVEEPRSLFRPVIVLAGAGDPRRRRMSAIQGVFATVAFGALAAIVCRVIQLALKRRGVGNGAGDHDHRRRLRPRHRVAGRRPRRVDHRAERRARQGHGPLDRRSCASSPNSSGSSSACRPPRSRQIDIEQLISAARSLLAAVTPVVTGLAMAVLIVTYLLLDADRLRARMIGVTSQDVDRPLRRPRDGARRLRQGPRHPRRRPPRSPTPSCCWSSACRTRSSGASCRSCSRSCPTSGSCIALIPPTILAFLDGGIVPALAVVGGYVAINLAFDYVLQPRMLSISLDLSPVVTIVSILVWTVVIGPMGALLAVPLTIAMRAILMPFPGAHWFVAILGPVPGAKPEDVEAGADRGSGRPAASRAGPAAPARERPRLPPIRRSPSRRSRSAPTAPRSSTPTGASTSTRPGGAVVVGIGHGRQEVARRRRGPARHASRTPTARRSRPSPSSATPSGSGPQLPMADPAIYPVSGGSEADRDGAQARPRHPAGARREGPRRRDRPVGELPRQQPRRAGPVGPPPAPRARTRPGSAGSATSAPRTRTAAHVPGSQAMDDPRALAAELEVAIQRRRRGPRRRVRRGADRRGDARRRRAARRLLAGHRRGLPPPRRAARRRRGHDRVRPDRDLVRDGPVRGRAGPARRGQGRDVRLLAVRVRARRRARSGRPSRRAAGSSTGSPTRTSRAPPRSPSRCCGSSRTERLVEASAAKGERLLGLLRARLGDHPNVGDIRGRGLLAGVELVRDRETKAPFPRSQRLVEACVRLARERGLLLYSGTGNANGIDGDVIVLGPPFVVTDDELARIADGIGEALDAALAEVAARSGPA